MVNHVVNMMCICGTLIDDDVVLRLQKKVQILTSLGRDETTIAEYQYHVWDGIDQHQVGFLQFHFLAQAKTFDGILVQVTGVFSWE